MNDSLLNPPPLQLGRYQLNSRLILGTGKYQSYPLMAEALKAADVDMVTVAVRRIPEGEAPGEAFLDFVDAERYTLLPNTAGCFDAETALRTCRLAREMLDTDLVKLEVLGDTRTLLPDPVDTLRALEQLVAEEFTVLVYTSDDVRQAKRLEEAGATAVMPLGSPIGSGRGILNPLNIRLIVEELSVPVLVDAGVGQASDVAVAMELGADGVLLNTAVAKAQDPVRMATAVALACRAGYHSFHAGRMDRGYLGAASSPTSGLIEATAPAAARS